MCSNRSTYCGEQGAWSGALPVVVVEEWESPCFTLPSSASEWIEFLTVLSPSLPAAGQSFRLLGVGRRNHVVQALPSALLLSAGNKACRQLFRPTPGVLGSGLQGDFIVQGTLQLFRSLSGELGVPQAPPTPLCKEVDGAQLC